jgi:hypothetical protein
METIYNPVNFQFETLINGGFGNASFKVPSFQQKSHKMFSSYVGYHVVAFDCYGRRVYEGRIDTIDLDTDGVSVSCIGYYGHASDLTFGMIYDGSVAKSATAIIKDIIDLADDVWWNDKSQLEESNLDITPQDFTGESKLADAIEEALKYGGDPGNNNDPRPLHFQIWEQRRPFLVHEKQITDNPDWFIALHDLAGGASISLSRSRSEVYNKIQILYDDEVIGATFTDWFEDTASQLKYGVREGSINIGQSNDTIANIVGALAIKAYAEPEQTTRIVVQGKPLSFGGISDFPYMLRAGDFITISDNIYSVGYTSAQISAMLSSGIVARTAYNLDNNQLDIEFGKRSVAMDILLARIGVSSGSVR